MDHSARAQDRAAAGADRMTIVENAAYEWRVYNAKALYRLENARGRTESLIKGRIFGLRQAGSKKGVYRLIVRELGPRMVFSLSEQEVLGLLKKSSPLTDASAHSHPRAKTLLSRLQKTDPKDFWAVVAALNWPKFAHDDGYADTARSVLRECYRQQDLSRLLRTAARMRRELQRAVEKAEKAARRQLFLGGDDSFYDALAYAVSSGQARFEGFVRKPESFVKKFNALPMDRQNFEYCFE
ncbi:hypothetical protein [Lysobacter capsici]|uniref:hypothetical protein n=1 Tax=Lysobacter capsici TaxID=435897 RepID=UPI0012FDC5BB|nr:hypothetical protein [Lysobacter capsici]